MTLSDIPEDSLLHKFIAYMSWTESAMSFQVAGGLSAIGVALRRHRWYSQGKWEVWPNQSVMFIGPSGVGKDTIINQLEACIRPYVLTVGGTTFGAVSCRLVNLSPPTIAYIPIKEMAAFFGKVDYQQNSIAMVTDLLSSNKEVDVSTKGDLTREDGRAEPKIIYEPTITIHAGSTVDWLHNMLPHHAMTGGFIGRFHLAIETTPSRSVPLIGDGKSPEEWALHNAEWKAWEDGLLEIIRECNKAPQAMPMTPHARLSYVDWYDKRRSIFPAQADAYAYRARDTVLRFAIQSAVSRQHLDHIDDLDMQLAISLVNDTASKIRLVLDPGYNPDLSAALLAYIPFSPRSIVDIYGKFLSDFTKGEIDATLTTLTAAGSIIPVDISSHVRKFYKTPVGGATS